MSFSIFFTMVRSQLSYVCVIIPATWERIMKHTLYALLQRFNIFPKYICVQKKQPMYKAVETRQQADGSQYKYI